MAQVVRAMEQEAGLAVPALRVDGGLTQAASLMQLQADLAGVPVLVAREEEATVMGAAYMAARVAGLLASDADVRARAGAARVFEPRIGADERQARLARFDRAIELARAWGAP